MKRFFTYFDLLGYGQLLEKNSFEVVKERIKSLLLDIEWSLSKNQHTKPTDGVVFADLSQSQIFCLNYSDTILFCANDSFDGLKELFEISYNFYWKEVLYNFPLRGAMFYDEIDFITMEITNNNGGIYRPNAIFGKGLMNAYYKAESLNYAGCVIDESVLSRISEEEEFKAIIEKNVVKYDVPYITKNKCKIVQEGYVFRLFESNNTLTESAFNNLRDKIIRGFTSDNKDGNNDRAKELFGNTIGFLEFLIPPQY